MDFCSSSGQIHSAQESAVPGIGTNRSENGIDFQIPEEVGIALGHGSFQPLEGEIVFAQGGRDHGNGVGGDIAAIPPLGLQFIQQAFGIGAPSGADIRFSEISGGEEV